MSGREGAIERGRGRREEGGRERGREREREGAKEREERVCKSTSLIMISLHDCGRNFPLEAGNTPMSCSRGAKGVVPLSKSLRTRVMFLKSEENGA